MSRRRGSSRGDRGEYNNNNNMLNDGQKSPRDDDDNIRILYRNDIYRYRNIAVYVYNMRRGVQNNVGYYYCYHYHHTRLPTWCRVYLYTFVIILLL